MSGRFEYRDDFIIDEEVQTLVIELVEVNALHGIDETSFEVDIRTHHFGNGEVADRDDAVRIGDVVGSEEAVAGPYPADRTVRSKKDFKMTFDIDRFSLELYEVPHDVLNGTSSGFAAFATLLATARQSNYRQYEDGKEYDFFHNQTNLSN